MTDDFNGIDTKIGGDQSRKHADHRSPGRVEKGAGRSGKQPGGAEGASDPRRQLEAAEQALEEARAAANESTDKYVRLAAEMDNIRRRHRQEQADQLQYANSELITKLLPVLDNFHRALDHAPEGVEGPAEQLRSGLLMIVKQFEDILESEGVRPIETEGQFFDPNLHQAVTAEPSIDYEEGQIIAELQRGYTLHDRVLRPSLVKVSRNS
ncbi:MAG TPA: nucleotide exchange factor GrpE [Candidatus Solibacter sp.]|jgi:molecular chaperone GrpE|nr:nucleotide exchange factor GrpE [Candidatus Solibacter sp.]